MCVQGTDDLLLLEAWPAMQNEVRMDRKVDEQGNNKRYVRDKKERTICLISGNVRSLIGGKMGNPSSLDLSGHGTLLSEACGFVGRGGTSSSPPSGISREVSGCPIMPRIFNHTIGFAKKCIPFLPNIPTNLIKGWQKCGMGGMCARGFQSDQRDICDLREWQCQ